MVVEWKKVRVRPEARDLYLEKDREIWTAGLAREEAFLGKEVWLCEDSGIVLIVRWRGEEEWKGMPKDRIEELDRWFCQAVPEDLWETVETTRYEVIQPA